MNTVTALSDSNLTLVSNFMPTAEQAWQQIDEKQKSVAIDKSKIVNEVKRIQECGYSRTASIKELCLRFDTEENIDSTLFQVALKLGKHGKCPSYSTIKSWMDKEAGRGLLGLIPQYKGSSQTIYDWHARAIHLHSLPSKPSKAAVARKLREEGFGSAEDSRVASFISALPAELGDKSPGRMGKRLYINTQKTFKRRTTDDLPVGTCYQGDGHTLDVYLQHPNGNKVWRAELTVWLDVTSRYVVGWYLSEAESAHSTLFALSHAILSQNHIPAQLHIDNGSGYKNKMMSDDSTGFYARLGIDIMHSLPYNAKGKGHVERFFGTMERDYNKWYPSYCGADMAPEALQLLLKQHKKGEVTLPTREQWMDGFRTWLSLYHNKPHAGLDGKTPAQLWATLERFAPEDTSMALECPRVERTVIRQAITLDKREYMAPELVQYNGKKIVVEYNLHVDHMVRILDTKMRWLCDAQLVKKQAYLPESRIQEAVQKRLIASTKRKQIHQAEAEERAGLAWTHVDALEADKQLSLQQKTASEDAVLNAKGDKTVSEINIDIFDTDY